MNSIKIYVDKQGEVLKCRYYENNDDEKYYLISNDKVNYLLDILVYNYEKKFILKKNSDGTFLFTVNNIDEKIIEPYISNNKFKSQKKKVKRINKFKKIFLIVGTTISITSSILLISCASSKKDQDNSLDSTTIEYTTENKEPTLPQIIQIIDLPADTKSSIEESTHLQSTSETIDESIPTISTNSHEETPISDNTEVNNNEPIILSIKTGDDTKSNKYLNCKKNYFDLIVKYSNIYGVDPYLMLAIASQEKGVHSDVIDKDGGLGLFQIQMTGEWTWDGKEMYAFNFETNSWEEFHITFDKMTDLENNIKAACMHVQECCVATGYNLAKLITAYNSGCDGLEEAIKNVSEAYGYDISYFDDPTHLEWLNYRNYTDDKIDPVYIENVLNWMESGTTMRFITPEGKIIEYTYINQENNLGLKK